MTIGTEGNDVLSNDQKSTRETIDALGGDDRINVTTAHPDGDPLQWSTVTVNGGAGIDTLSISAPYITSLSSTSALIHDGRASPGIFVYRYPTSVSYSGIERMVVSGSGYFGLDQFGRYLSGSWSTGDTADEIHALSTQGGASLNVYTAGGDDRIYLGNVGYGSAVYAGTGADIVDLSGFSSGFGSAYGEGGDDILIGSPTLDVLDGGPGADSMTGGAGDDLYYVDDPGDSVVEAAGGGIDTVFTTLAVYALGADLEKLYARGGGAHDFTLNSAANYVHGNTGNDLFRLQSGGDDTADGDDGDDTFYFGDAFTGSDRVQGGSGGDTVVLQGSYAMTLGTASLTGVETLSLQSGANPQWGDTANNLYSYAITTIEENVGSGQQLVVDARSLRAGESLTFNGSAETNGSFAVYGGAGIDRITGGSGNDIISGGGGADTLAGGPGDDLFVYASVADSPGVGRDRITGFALGDRIDLSAIDAIPSTAAEDAFTFIGGNPFSGSAGELRAVSGASGWTVSADLNGDGYADFSLVVLTSDGHLATSANFVL